MDSDGNTNFNPCFHDVCIQDLTAARHVRDSLTEAIMPRTAGSLSTIVLPGLYSVIVPVASVVVVVVVVSETCAHAKGTTNAKAMLNTIFFMFSPLLVELRQSYSPSFPSKFDDLPLYPIRIRFVLWMFCEAVFS